MEVYKGVEAFRSDLSLVSDFLSGRVCCVEEWATFFGPAVAASYSMVQETQMDQDLLIIQASRSHSVRYTTLGRTPLNE
jgi:hypothetical protein